MDGAIFVSSYLTARDGFFLGQLLLILLGGLAMRRIVALPPTERHSTCIPCLRQSCILVDSNVLFAILTKLFAITEGFCLPIHDSNVFRHITLETGLAGGTRASRRLCSALMAVLFGEERLGPARPQRGHASSRSRCDANSTGFQTVPSVFS